MAHVVVVKADEDGKISLTKQELETMLNEAYQNGWNDAPKTTTISAPTIPVWYGTTVCDYNTVSI